MPDAASGALSGAATGAAVGSVVPGIGTAIGAGVGLIGGLLSGLFGSAGREEAMQEMEKAVPGFKNLNPRVQAQIVSQVDSSAYNRADQTGNSAMRDALSQLEDKYRSGGLDAVDRAKAAELANVQAQQSKSNAAAVQENALRSGTLNSGNALVAQLMGSQSAGDAAAKQSVEQAAEAERARMAAIQGAAGVGQNLQQNAYTVAGANDAVNRFNAGIREGNADRNLQAQQDTFNNSYNQATGLSNAYANAANLREGNAANTQNTIATVAQGAAGAARALGNYDWTGGGSQPAPNYQTDMNRAVATSRTDDPWNTGQGVG